MPETTEKKVTPTPPEFVPHWQGKPEDPKEGKYVACHAGWKLVLDKKDK